MIPEGWARSQIGDVCAAIVDCVNKTAPVVDGPTPYKMIRTTNVRHGLVDTQNVRYVTEETYRTWTRRGELEDGDIILTREAPVGEVGQLRNADGMFLGQRTMVYRADATLMDQRFLYQSMIGPSLTRQYHADSAGGTVAHIRVPDCSKFLLMVPPLSEQRKIADILSTWDQAIEKTEALLANARTQKRALMQQLLTGKRRFPAFEGQPWNSGKLVDHFDFINGRAFKPDDWGDVGFPIIRIQNLTGSTDAINYYDGVVDEKHTIRSGDFLLSWSATLDTFIWTGPVAVLNQHIFKVVPKSDTLKMFGFHLITHEIGKLVSKVHGTSMKHITKKDLAKIESFFPSLAEQEKITEALDDADRFVNDVQADLTKLRTEKKALMQQLLTGKRRVVV